MKLNRILVPLALLFSLSFISCGEKDTDITTSVEKTYTDNTISGVSSTVKDGVVTLTGEVENEAAKAKAEELAKGVKGVKSVTNNITITQAAPVQMSNDGPLMQGVTDATKDYPGVTATVNDGVVTLTGNITRDKLSKLMMSLNSLKPKQILNQLTIK